MMNRAIARIYSPGELPFLQSVYEDEGVDYKQEKHNEEVRKLRIQEYVGKKIIGLLLEGKTEFPTLDITDPTGRIEVPTMLHINRFNEVTYRDLMRENSSPQICHEAGVDIRSPYRHSDMQYSRIGGLSISTHTNATNIERVSLARGRSTDESVLPKYILIEDPEAQALLEHTANYLNRIPDPNNFSSNLDY